MYVIRRNNHYYNKTHTDTFKDSRIPSVRHVFTADIYQAKQFDNKVEAYNMAEKVGGDHVEKAPPPKIKPNLTLTLSREEFITQRMHDLRAYLKRDDIQRKIHVSASTAQKMWYGDYKNTSIDTIDKVYLILKDAPTDESIIEYEDNRFIHNRIERKKRFNYLKELIFEYKDENTLTWEELGDEFDIYWPSLASLCNSCTYIPSAVILWKIETALESLGYEIGYKIKENEHE